MFLLPQNCKTFEKNKTAAIAFPVGGIGTGCISVSGRGALIDWEIYNQANKGFKPRWTFLSLKCKQHGQEAKFKILEGQLLPPFEGRDERQGWGPSRERLSGLPRMKNCKFSGITPVAQVELDDPDIPLLVCLEFYNPVIPGDSENSSLPVVMVNIHLENISDKPVDASVIYNMMNPVGFPIESHTLPDWKESGDIKGFIFKDIGLTPDDSRYGSFSVTTPWEDVSFTADHLFENHDYPGYFQIMQQIIDSNQLNDKINDKRGNDRLFPVGTMSMRAQNIKQGESLTVPLTLTWHNSWQVKTWGKAPPEDPNNATLRKNVDSEVRWHPYYTTKFEDAWEVAVQAMGKREYFENEIQKYLSAIDKTDIPESVISAAFNNVSTLSTPTVLRVPDGTLWGWEGCAPETGVCWGSANHVWGFAQVVPYFYGDLDRSMIESFFQPGAFREADGYMAARVDLPLGTDSLWSDPASDGQFTMILRAYRAWQLSGNDGWLLNLWGKIQKTLEYVWNNWDKDKDGFMEQPHSHTYDGTFNSAEPQSQILYLAALRATEEIALYFEDATKANKYKKLFESGSQKTDELLFNGEYYCQYMDPLQDDIAQLGNGCLIDQLLGQWHAHNLGLGYLLSPENVKRAVKSIYKYNFRKTGYDNWINLYRTYAINDEQGSVICSWPHNDKPDQPFLYCDETMTGFEHQLGSLLIHEGFVNEGLEVIKAVRDRFDGEKRNPWNEFECGSHYARAMSSYAHINTLSGFKYSAVEKSISFTPATDSASFSSFWCTPSAWGVVKITQGSLSIEVLHGEIEISRISTSSINTTKAEVLLDNELKETSIRHENYYYLSSAIKVCSSHIMTLKV